MSARTRRRVHQEELQFQLAPMIDVIFVLILFFMVTAGSVKVENELSIRLPGTVVQAQSVPIEEQMLQIEVNGQVMLNDAVYDSPASKELPELERTLVRFRELAKANNTQPLLTIMSAPKARYERVIDVLNACAAAKIEGVTFTTSEGG